jgi:hypothetical protein
VLTWAHELLIFVRMLGGGFTTYRGTPGKKIKQKQQKKRKTEVHGAEKRQRTEDMQEDLPDQQEQQEQQETHSAFRFRDHGGRSFVRKR